MERDFPGIVIAEEPEWKDCIQGSNAVVNLAGMPMSTRWSPETYATGTQLLIDSLDNYKEQNDSREQDLALRKRTGPSQFFL
ncbi:unnamed protein product [Camellia sinensis]